MIEDKVKVFDFPLECHTAYYFAKCKHDEIHQIRKGTGAPYFIHPKGVALIVKQFGGSIDQICAALLHDTLEDTHTSDEELRVCFGEHIQQLVKELTNQHYKIEEMGKEAYMTEKLLKLSNEALLVKIADINYNLQDMPTEQAEIRMFKNLKALLLGRQDISENTRNLIIQTFLI